MSRGCVARWAACALLALAGAPRGHAEGLLTVATWGGEYSAAQSAALFDPFTARFGVALRSEVYNGALQPLRVQRAAGAPQWDLVNVDQRGLREGCSEGLFERVDVEDLLQRARPAGPVEDWLAPALQECGVASTVRSLLFFYSTERFAGHPPQSVADVFDVASFPGKRGLPRDARGNLEWALLADGVPPAEIYAVLDTPAGTSRAFARLAELRPHVVWWRSVTEPQALLAGGEVAIAAAFGELAGAAVLREGLAAAPLWQGQLWQLDYWAIVSGTANLEAARKFLAFATDTPRQIELARYLPFGPVRRSALALSQPEIRALLPSSEERLAAGLQVDLDWWWRNGRLLRERFAEWLQSVERPQ